MLQVNTMTSPQAVIEYPEDDGLPMADNGKQFRLIVTIAGNLAGIFRDRADVLVGGNMLWYTREGDPAERFAPDVFVVFGRPKGDRHSYLQWEENDVPMTVVFEILSLSNTPRTMIDKSRFYSEYGVEEFYIYDPDTHQLDIYLRGKAALRKVLRVDGFVSPRLGIRFDMSESELVLYRPDGRRFLPFEELDAERETAVQQATSADRRASEAQARATKAEQRFARLAELIRKQTAQQATAEELQELQLLLQQPAIEDREQQ